MAAGAKNDLLAVGSVLREPIPPLLRRAQGAASTRGVPARRLALWQWSREGGGRLLVEIAGLGDQQQRLNRSPYPSAYLATETK